MPVHALSRGYHAVTKDGELPGTVDHHTASGLPADAAAKQILREISKGTSSTIKRELLFFVGLLRANHFSVKFTKYILSLSANLNFLLIHKCGVQLISATRYLSIVKILH
ncbi:MAG TPA: hypothetical protein VFI29_23560 [Hanamia sp.]|nr:hypothetical protein [Hanamia sp.]